MPEKMSFGTSCASRQAYAFSNYVFTGKWITPVCSQKIRYKIIVAVCRFLVPGAETVTAPRPDVVQTILKRLPSMCASTHIFYEGEIAVNKNLSKAIDAVERADALLYAIENCYLNFEVPLREMERANRGVHMIYALWDAVKSAKESLRKLEEDRHVVDVIYAASDARWRDDSGTSTKED